MAAWRESTVTVTTASASMAMERKDMVGRVARDTGNNYCTAGQWQKTE